MNLKEIVEVLLVESKKSKKELAEYMNVHQGNLNKALASASLDTQNKVASYFDMSVSDLLSFEVPSNNKRDLNYLEVIQSQQRTIESLSRTIENLTNK